MNHPFSISWSRELQDNYLATPIINKIFHEIDDKIIDDVNTTDAMTMSYLFQRILEKLVVSQHIDLQITKKIIIDEFIVEAKLCKQANQRFNRHWFLVEQTIFHMISTDTYTDTKVDAETYASACSDEFNKFNDSFYKIKYLISIGAPIHQLQIYLRSVILINDKGSNLLDDLERKLENESFVGGGNKPSHSDAILVWIVREIVDLVLTDADRILYPQILGWLNRCLSQSQFILAHREHLVKIESLDLEASIRICSGSYVTSIVEQSKHN
jgi:hypothetical protein